MDEVKLRKLRLEDKERLLEFANNAKIAVNLRDGFPHPYTINDAGSFLKNVTEKLPDQIFAIEYNGVYVGNISLMRCQDVYRKSAEIGYLLDEEYWNRGIMSRAVRLICEYGFREMEIERIHTGIFEYNTASQRVLEKCGFRQEGVFVNSVFKQGRLWNEIRYALLKDQFNFE
ncbi:GNAT family N-acetyltransferase [Bacteroidota bacterium]